MGRLSLWCCNILQLTAAAATVLHLPSLCPSGIGQIEASIAAAAAEATVRQRKKACWTFPSEILSSKGGFLFLRSMSLVIFCFLGFLPKILVNFWARQSHLVEGALCSLFSKVSLICPKEILLSSKGPRWLSQSLATVFVHSQRHHYCIWKPIRLNLQPDVMGLRESTILYYAQN